MAARKRVLLAEAADTVRQVAETVLRQNGFEVISVTGADKAGEVLSFSRPDLIVMSADLNVDNHPFYETIQADRKTAAIPLVLIEREDHADLPFPPEVVVSRPLDPRDLLQKVMTFSGQGDSTAARPVPASFGASGIDDELLDAALGLDRIDVTASEVLDRTTMHLKTQAAGGTGHIPVYNPDHKNTEDHSESAKVESLMIRDEASEIGRRPAPTAPPPKKMSGTSKLEIMSDQYGLHDPNAMQFERKDDVHDYDWFVKSMRDDGSAKGGKADPTQRPQPGADSFDLSFTDPASLVDPVTPAVQPAAAQAGPEKPDGSRSAVGVDKFIDEFKKEIERIRASEGEPVMAEEAKARPQASGGQLAWEETLEKVNSSQVEFFSRQLAVELAAQLAEKIAAKIDSEKLLQLIKAEIVNRMQQRHQ